MISKEEHNYIVDTLIARIEQLEKKQQHLDKLKKENKILKELLEEER